jgi:hypothetical protein
MTRNIIVQQKGMLEYALLKGIEQTEPTLQERIKEIILRRLNDLVERGNAIFSVDLPLDDEGREIELRRKDIEVSIPFSLVSILNLV